MEETKGRIATEYRELLTKDQSIIPKIIQLQSAALGGDHQEYRQLEEGLMEYLDNGESIDQSL